MGSAASVSDAKKEEVEVAPRRVAEEDDAQVKDEQSVAPHNVEEEQTSRQEEPASHVVDISSSEENDAETQDEAGEEIETLLRKTMTEASTETELSLAFESFLHKDGTLYSCFSQHGSRVYVDETNQVTNQNAPPSGGHAHTPAEPAVADDDRASAVYIQGKGMIMTYMFEEKANTCRYFDPQTGLWLLMPLQWEMDVEFVRTRVQRVMGALPGLGDQKEITAALRQCNYDPDEVISAYLTIFGDVLFQPADREQHNRELNSFRSHLEKDRAIEDLKQKLQDREREAEALLQRNSSLAREAQYLSDVLQHLNLQVAELEADRQEAREKIRALLSRRPTAPPVRPEPKPGVDPARLRALSGLTRGLNVANKQLRASLGQWLQEARLQMRELEEEARREARELRGLYRKEAVERKALYNRLLELQGNIRVFCRCRASPAATSCLDVSEEEEVAVTQKGGKRRFLFDKVYPSSASQEKVFEGTLPIITSCADGFNVCILAYGQTGSGKTYTMMGPKDKPGVNVRSIRELLRICKEREKVTYALKISMLEIYNDSLNDLLAKGPAGHLEIRAQGKSVTVPGLTAMDVETEEHILNVMELGEKNRKIASTKMNIQSSRSHLILTLRVEGTDSVSGATSHGTLTLCDLAGSERISKTEATGARLLEAASINKSLTALGQVFSALKCNALHVPFRNSKLTHLLQPCLSGDAKACVFVNVSPEPANLSETLSTLQFGSSIRQVVLGKATQHVAPAQNAKADK
ncbi:kinesin-like protein KIFC3 [Conger conger]|uniref:kinesin-like protein KIFC3 n=1 Tax=Conger conger TaxID=82655 RepID=UPI002A5A20CE|nr:kinesin-like protein KIFC3 [Conger conger]